MRSRNGVDCFVLISSVGLPEPFTYDKHTKETVYAFFVARDKSYKHKTKLLVGWKTWYI